MSDDLTQLAERIFERLPVKCPTCGSEEPTTYYGSCFDNQHDTVLDPRLPMDPWHAYMQDLRLLLRRLDGMTVCYEVGRTLLAEARDEIARLREGIERHRDAGIADNCGKPGCLTGCGHDSRLWALLDASSTASPVRDGTNTEQDEP